jgi:hypothetical protein
MKETHALNARYGNIGIPAVAAAVRYTTAGASLPMPSSGDRVRSEKAEPNTAVRCGFQLPGHKLEPDILTVR